MNQAALRGAILGCNKITMEHFEWAKDKIMMGNSFVDFLKII